MKVYVVGGAVRDMLLSRKPKDTDYVVVGSTPEEMVSFGFKQVGADFPVFLHPTTGDEWALARVERKVGVGYHGFETAFDSSVTIEDDLRRRDLTINAMAYEVSVVKQDGTIVAVPNKGLTTLIDPFGGEDDLHSGILRHTSEAFSEDPLRVLRLARFAARFDFMIAPDTIELCKEVIKSGELDEVSYERYWKEITRAFVEPHPMNFFHTLFLVDAVRTVSFFKKWLGDMKYSRIAMIFDSIQLIEDHEDELSESEFISCMLAVISAFNRNADFADIKMQSSAINDANMLINIGDELANGMTAIGLHKTLKLIGVWRTPVWFTNLNPLLLYELLGEVPETTTDLVLYSAKVAAMITAEVVAPGEQGPHVGTLLQAARNSACQRAIEAFLLRDDG